MVGPLILATLAMAQDCHYQSWTWSVRERRPVDVRPVATYRAKLTSEERGTVEGCSICEEDQVELNVGKQRFKICQRFAPTIQSVLNDIGRTGFPLLELEGYRVGKSKGPIDPNGKRTQFSHHSYGIALDINASLNGLYENCPSFSPHCRLLRGGAWQVTRPGTIVPQGIVVEKMKAAGFKWGGELAGQQKDFMHFSPSGD